MRVKSGTLGGLLSVCQDQVTGAAVKLAVKCVDAWVFAPQIAPLGLNQLFH